MLQTTTQTDALSNPVARPGLHKGVLIKGIALAILVVVVVEVLRTFVGTNFHPVLAGRCYRAAQPTASFLDALHRRHGIRSVINLRGDNPGEPWFDREAEAAKRLNLVLYDAGLSSSEQAPAVDFAKFVQAMRDAEEPILIHCANGNDRSGFASAVYFMMRTDMSIPEARKQLSLRFGHIPWSKASCLGRIFDSYETWLATNGWTHSPDRFHFWGTKIYRPEPLR